ncbi:MAG: glycosyl transferase [Planctomycetaceae bacterium]|nr:glycosyl transferase [Planctomycetaceae bacterium]
MTPRRHPPEHTVPVLHVVIPFLDEESTLNTIVDRLEACPWPEGWSASVVLVDDGSGPNAADASKRLAGSDREIDVRLLQHEANRGKGAALRTGFQKILETADEADLVGVQDADLEYDPTDLARIVTILIEATPKIDAVFGNRWSTSRGTTIRRIHRLGNQTLTRISNVLTGLSLSDMECCYKVIRVPMLRRILPDLDENRFAIEPQLAASLARHGAKLMETPVSYEPRSFSEGKKIGARDGIAAVLAMLREWRRTRRHRGGEA